MNPFGSEEADGVCAESGFPISAHVYPKVYRSDEFRKQRREDDRCTRFDERIARERLDIVRFLGLPSFNTFSNNDVWWDLSENAEIAHFFQAYLNEHTELAMSSFHYIGSVYEESAEKTDLLRRQMVETAELYGPCHPTCFVLHPGTFGEGRFRGNLQNYREAVSAHGERAVMRAVADNIRFFATEAEKYGVRIAVENLYGGRVYSGIDELLELVQFVERDDVGFCLDTGHAHVDHVDIPEAIRAMGDKLFELHLHDNVNSDEHKPVGFGTIDWAPIICALRDVGYRGTASFEFFRWPCADFRQGLSRAIGAWRAFEQVAFDGYSYFDWF